MPSSFYPKALEKLLKGELDLDGTGDTVKVMLLGNVESYTFGVSHEFVSNITGELANGTGGVAGYERKTIPVSIEFDADAGGSPAGALAGVFLKFTLTDNAVWGPSAPANPAAATFTTAHAVMYVDKAGADSVKPVLYYFDLGGNQVVSSGTFELKDPSPQPKLRRIPA